MKKKNTNLKRTQRKIKKAKEMIENIFNESRSYTIATVEFTQGVLSWIEENNFVTDKQIKALNRIYIDGVINEV